MCVPYYETKKTHFTQNVTGYLFCVSASHLDNDYPSNLGIKRLAQGCNTLDLVGLEPTTFRS